MPGTLLEVFLSFATKKPSCKLWPAETPKSRLHHAQLDLQCSVDKSCSKCILTPADFLEHDGTILYDIVINAVYAALLCIGPCCAREGSIDAPGSGMGGSDARGTCKALPRRSLSCASEMRLI